MDEKELIRKIKELQDIKPSQNWVVLTRNQILGEAARQTDFAKEKLSVVSVFRLMLQPKVLVPISFAFVAGIFFFSQFSLPGEQLHLVKKISETTQGTFVSEEQKPEFYLSLAEKRAEELKKIVENNQVAKLSPAIKEYQETLKKASESLDKESKETNQTIKIAEKVTALQEKTKEIEKSLDIEFKEMGEVKEKVLACVKGGIENTKNQLAVLVNGEIASLENSSLNESQQAVLSEIKQMAQQGDYSGAWEKILFLNNQ